jgi:DNA-binding NarL/FixJ family response regulator
MIRIVIVDSQKDFLDNAIKFLSQETDIDIVGMGRDGYDAIRLVQGFKPDVALLDTDLPLIDGVSAITTLKKRSQYTKFIVFTMTTSDRSIAQAICNGATGFFMKNTTMDKISLAIRNVYSGGCGASPEIEARVFALFSQALAKSAGSSGMARGHGESVLLKTHISKNEFRIALWVGRGFSNQEIARELNLTTGTVRNYISGILQKTGLRNRTAIAVYMLATGLVNVDDLLEIRV